MYVLFYPVLGVTRMREITRTVSNGFHPARKPLKVYPPPASSRKACKDPVDAITQSQLSALDPTGDRKALFDYRRNPRSVKPGDILRVIFKNGDPFSGVCLSIRLRGVDTSFLLRNQLTRVGVEMSVKVFSPEVQSVEIVQRSEKRRRRARLYYLRYVGSLPVCWVDLFANSFSTTDNPDTISAVWRIPSPTISRRSLLLLVSERRDGDRAWIPCCVWIW